MDWLLEVAIIAGMFVLRLGVPLAITLAVGYWLRQLDAKWQTEALSQQATRLAEQTIEAEPELEMFRHISQPCWLVKDCSESARLGCPACQNPEVPCWMARYRVEGHLPGRCYHCELFSPRRERLPLW